MRKNYCIINGKLREVDEASITVNDSAFLLGDGLFETIKVANKVPVWLDEHLARMEKSARFAGIDFSKKSSCADWCKKLIAENKIDEGFLRITLSRGATLAITGANFSPNKKPFKAAFASWPINELDPAAFHKTTSRFSFTLAGRELKRNKLDELIFLNTKGEIAEGTKTNIFWIKGGELFTPAIECGLLPGIARSKVIERARNSGMKVTEGRFFTKSLMEADEIFFTNSLIFLRPCIEINGHFKSSQQMSHALSKVCFWFASSSAYQDR